MAKIRLVYTSDTHGRLSAHDFLSDETGPFGLSRLSSFLSTLDSRFLLFDNGDFLQGSPLLDYCRKNRRSNPVANVFSKLGYSCVNLGNHDFNFGLKHLRSFHSQYGGPILCANIVKDEIPVFQTHTVFELEGIRIAVIGVTTEYIPHWEKEENLDGLYFLDVVETVQSIISEHRLRATCDVIAVLYHGGFRIHMETLQPIGPQTNENKAYELSRLQDVDVLLTGHQHIPQIHCADNRVAIQTSHNAFDVGVVEIEKDASGTMSFGAKLVRLADYEPDDSIETLLQSDIEATRRYLSKTIGTTAQDLLMSSPLAGRARKHPLFQLVNEIQMEYTGADVSIASLPNDARGFASQIALKEIAAHFPYENDLVVLNVNGKTLKEALEKNATYFVKVDGTIEVNPTFLFPKVEHYNYDVYDGIEYSFDLDRPIGDRVTKLTYRDKPILPDQTFTCVLNSYRASGSGGFDMFKACERLETYPVSYFDLVCDYVERHPLLEIELKENFVIQ
jgi:2',3'-cyclic-nucleotide 2'-phosphodiesterase / 3'-nucleotidase